MKYLVDTDWIIHYLRGAEKNIKRNQETNETMFAEHLPRDNEQAKR